MRVVKRDGSEVKVDKSKIEKNVARACEGLEDVSVEEIVQEAFLQLYDGIATREIDQATVMAARSRIVFEPNYNFVAARLLLYALYREAIGKHFTDNSLDVLYRKSFEDNLKELAEIGELDPRMLKRFDLEMLAASLKPERDLLFQYPGIKTLYDRYFLQNKGRRLETPQAFWMRVAMGLCLEEKDSTKAAIEAYHMFSTFRYCPATPTLLHSGTDGNLFSCYLSTLTDSIEGIFAGGVFSHALLSKNAGGLGIDLTPLRANGSWIGHKGRSNGIVPWARQFNEMCLAVDQAGKRPGKAALYLEVWHPDIEEFIDLKKATGDERRRCHDIHTAVWVPDLFMQKVKDDEDWHLFCPSECPDLHELFGQAFVDRYQEYVSQAETGELDNFRVVKAKTLWKKILASLAETGHPWINWKDPSNIRYPNQHEGVVHSSNLCTEILEHTKPSYWKKQERKEVGEVAVCVLGSVNLPTHQRPDGTLDEAKLRETTRFGVRMLSNAIDLNAFPIDEAEKSALLHRHIGLGSMGWADYFFKQGLAMDMADAVEEADFVQEIIAHEAILASASLAEERGQYATYKGSTWSQGKMPLDTYKEVMDNRPEGLANYGCKQNWDVVRAAVKKKGLHNACLTTIPPTSTISTIQNCSSSIDPYYSHLFAQKALSGDFTIVNEHMVKDLKEMGLWSKELAREIQKNDGDLSPLNLPAQIKRRYRTAFQLDRKKLIEMAARRQKWLCHSQSLNLFYDGASMRAMSEMYMHAWEHGVKTTYYLHGKAAGQIEKVNTCDITGECEVCQ